MHHHNCTHTFSRSQGGATYLNGASQRRSQLLMSPVGVDRSNGDDRMELTITIQKDACGYGMKVAYLPNHHFSSHNQPLHPFPSSSNAPLAYSLSHSLHLSAIRAPETVCISAPIPRPTHDPPSTGIYFSSLLSIP